MICFTDSMFSFSEVFEPHWERDVVAVCVSEVEEVFVAELKYVIQELLTY